MSDLDQLRATPRDPALVARWSRKIEPISGFVAYGVLYIFLSMAALLAGVFGAIGIVSLVGLATGGAAANILTYGLAFGLWIASWWPYAWWARRKRKRAATLIRDGSLVEGKVATKTGDRVTEAAARLAMSAAGQGMYVHWDRVVFSHDGHEYSVVCPFAAPPQQGTPATVLFHPASKYALGFDQSGRAYVSGLHR